MSNDNGYPVFQAETTEDFNDTEGLFEPASRQQDNLLGPRLTGDEEAAFTAQGKKRMCMVLHGHNPNPFQVFNPNSKEVASLSDYVSARAKGWMYWSPNYQTQISFRHAAIQVRHDMKGWEHEYDLSQTIIIAYSMGGLVARQLIADGMPFSQLITICTPHQGILPWIPTPSAGSQSMHPLSIDLATLNNHPTDRAQRNKYFFFGMTNTIANTWHHENDAVVGIDSALGYKLGIERTSKMDVRFPGPPKPGMPHTLPQDAKWAVPALDYALQFMK
ncbi:MAG: hypothetical protein Q8J78_12925 [Moraxellaceae bacterium]|nr:hypothetical protein [Moraxellaceae bacterium]